MSEGAPSKLPWIATALAGIALTCALAAVSVVLVRDRPAPAPGAATPPPAVPALIDRRVEAT